MEQLNIGIERGVLHFSFFSQKPVKHGEGFSMPNRGYPGGYVVSSHEHIYHPKKSFSSKGVLSQYHSPRGSGIHPQPHPQPQPVKSIHPPTHPLFPPHDQLLPSSPFSSQIFIRKGGWGGEWGGRNERQIRGTRGKGGEKETRMGEKMVMGKMRDGGKGGKDLCKWYDTYENEERGR